VRPWGEVCPLVLQQYKIKKLRTSSAAIAEA